MTETVSDTWAWMQADDVKPSDAAGHFGVNGIDAAKERRILAAWHAR